MIRRSRRITDRSQRALDQLPLRASVVDAAFERDRGLCRADYIIRTMRVENDEQARALYMLKLIRCGGRMDPHEIIPRSAWPGGELVVANVVTICRRHHQWVDANPVLAHAVGLHGFSWERPDVVD